MFRPSPLTLLLGALTLLLFLAGTLYARAFHADMFSKGLVLGFLIALMVFGGRVRREWRLWNDAKLARSRSHRAVASLGRGFAWAGGALAIGGVCALVLVSWLGVRWDSELGLAPVVVVLVGVVLFAVPRVLNIVVSLGLVPEWRDKE